MVVRLVTTVLALLGAEVAPAVVIRAGRSFSYILDPASGTTLAMGRNSFGQLGIGSHSDSVPEPTEVNRDNMPSAVVDAAAGAFHGLFVTRAGLPYSVGRNNHGQLCGPAAVRRPTPVASLIRLLEENITVIGVAAGYMHSLFLLSDGSVWGCGYNNQGQLGDGTTTDARLEPVRLLLTEKVKAVAAGYDFSYFLTESGEVWAAGNGLGGQLGHGTREICATPIRATEGVERIVAGESHGLFVKAGGVLVGTGANFDGQLGGRSGNFAAIPIEVVPNAVEQAFAGGDSSCYVSAADARLYALGSNREDQLGLGNLTVTTGTPSQIEVYGAPELEAASIGERHSLFLARDDGVYSSGANAYGELGDGTTDPSDGWPMRIFEPPPATTTTSTPTSTFTTASATTTKGTATTTATVSATSTTSASSRRVQDTGSRMFYFVFAAWSTVAGVGLLAVCLAACLGREASRTDEAQTSSGDVELNRW